MKENDESACRRDNVYFKTIYEALKAIQRAKNSRQGLGKASIATPVDGVFAALAIVTEDTSRKSVPYLRL